MTIASNPKAQAAIEYLVTYGWAIVIILVIIGSLLYFGIISPNRFISDACGLGKEVECLEAQVGNVNDNDAAIIFLLQNNMGDDIIINRTETPDIEFYPPTDPNVDKDMPIANGDKAYFVMRTKQPFTPGDKVDFRVKLYFRRAEDPDSHDPNDQRIATYNISGRVISKVCGGDYVPRDVTGTVHPHFTTC